MGNAILVIKQHLGAVYNQNLFPINNNSKHFCKSNTIIFSGFLSVEYRRPSVCVPFMAASISFTFLANFNGVQRKDVVVYTLY